MKTKTTKKVAKKTVKKEVEVKLTELFKAVRSIYDQKQKGTVIVVKKNGDKTALQMISCRFRPSDLRQVINRLIRISDPALAQLADLLEGVTKKPF